MLYEALTGDVPFTAADTFKLMRKKAEEDPPAITSSDLPEDLSCLALRLLQKGGDKRPAGPELVKLFDVQSMLEPAPSETLVGRESQLAELGAALNKVESLQQTVTVCVRSFR